MLGSDWRWKSCFCIEYRSAATVTRITLYMHVQCVLKGISTNSGGQRPAMLYTAGVVSHIPQYDSPSRPKYQQ